MRTKRKGDPRGMGRRLRGSALAEKRPSAGSLPHPPALVDRVAIALGFARSPQLLRPLWLLDESVQADNLDARKVLLQHLPPQVLVHGRGRIGAGVIVDDEHVLALRRLSHAA